MALSKSTVPGILLFTAAHGVTGSTVLYVMAESESSTTIHRDMLSSEEGEPTVRKTNSKRRRWKGEGGKAQSSCEYSKVAGRSLV